MRAYAVAGLIGFASLTTIGAACNFKLGDDTEGEMGNMHFSYTGGRDCFFGCSLDREALQGSIVTVSVRGSTDGVRHARMGRGDAVASVANERNDCSCNKTSGSSSTSSSRTVEADATCAADEKKQCNMSVDLETTAEGDGKLEIIDRDGGVVDRVDVHVRAASRIETLVRSDAAEVKPGKDGIHEVKTNAYVSVASKVFGADDEELFFSRGGLGHAYRDKKIIAPFEELLGWTEIETMKAVAPGETTVTVTASGTTTVVRFRVMP